MTKTMSEDVRKIFYYRPAHSENFIFFTIFDPPPVGQGPSGPRPKWARDQVGQALIIPPRWDDFLGGAGKSSQLVQRYALPSLLGRGARLLVEQMGRWSSQGRRIADLTTAPMPYGVALHY